MARSAMLFLALVAGTMADSDLYLGQTDPATLIQTRPCVLGRACKYTSDVAVNLAENTNTVGGGPNPSSSTFQEVFRLDPGTARLNAVVDFEVTSLCGASSSQLYRVDITNYFAGKNSPPDVVQNLRRFPVFFSQTPGGESLDAVYTARRQKRSLALFQTALVSSLTKKLRGDSKKWLEDKKSHYEGMNYKFEAEDLAGRFVASHRLSVDTDGTFTLVETKKYNQTARATATHVMDLHQSETSSTKISKEGLPLKITQQDKMAIGDVSLDIEYQGEDSVATRCRGDETWDDAMADMSEAMGGAFRTRSLATPLSDDELSDTEGADERCCCPLTCFPLKTAFRKCKDLTAAEQAAWIRGAARRAGAVAARKKEVEEAARESVSMDDEDDDLDETPSDDETAPVADIEEEEDGEEEEEDGDEEAPDEDEMNAWDEAKHKVSTTIDNLAHKLGFDSQHEGEMNRDTGRLQGVRGKDTVRQQGALTRSTERDDSDATLEDTEDNGWAARHTVRQEPRQGRATERRAGRKTRKVAAKLAAQGRRVTRRAEARDEEEEHSNRRAERRQARRVRRRIKGPARDARLRSMRQLFRRGFGMLKRQATRMVKRNRRRGDRRRERREGQKEKARMNRVTQGLDRQEDMQEDKRMGRRGLHALKRAFSRESNHEEMQKLRRNERRDAERKAFERRQIHKVKHYIRRTRRQDQHMRDVRRFEKGLKRSVVRPHQVNRQFGRLGKDVAAQGRLGRRIEHRVGKSVKASLRRAQAARKTRRNGHRLRRQMTVDAQRTQRAQSQRVM